MIERAPLPVWKRAAILASLIVFPLLTYLKRNDYSLLRAESLASVGWLAGVCFVLAAAAPAGRPFYALLTVVIGLECATPVCLLAAEWYPAGPWEGFALAALAGAALLAAMREKAFPVLAAIAVASYAAVAFGKVHWMENNPGKPSGPAPAHALYLILDEHMGIGGFPAGIKQCNRAAEKVSAVFAKHRFTMHPNAYSNYPITLDSVPSAINRTLLSRSHQMVRQSENGSRVYALTENKLCFDGRRQGQSIYVCQHRAIDLNAGMTVDRLDYEDRLGDLQLASGDWTRKARWIIGGFQASDPILSKINSFFPFRSRVHGTGPMAIRDLWPARLAGQIEQAQAPTLFLIHLLAPHGPYLYARDGAVRPMEEWAGDRSDRRLTADRYRERYGRYCEQVEYLSSQIDGFFRQLDRQGILANMSVVVHGDHGSRIRLAFPGRTVTEETAYAPERFDYPSEPGLRDLLDRFSVLLAIKKPHQVAPRGNYAKESLLRVLERDYYGANPDRLGRAIDDVYLFTELGTPRSIAILDYWR